MALPKKRILSSVQEEVTLEICLRKSMQQRTETSNEHLEKLKDEVHGRTKSLARYADDADLDEKLKSIIPDDDPMSACMKKKKQKVAGTPNHLMYTGPPAPPSRFNIKPGYLWDGVDRSNGFEAKYFQKINQRKAVQDEAYLWSVSDM